jgi:hypothetical protein
VKGARCDLDSYPPPSPATVTVNLESHVLQEVELETWSLRPET